MTSEEIQALLLRLEFPSRFATRQTADTLLALADARPRPGLLPGHTSLAEGARIHDVLSFVRDEFGRTVAENTRETYRKTSLHPLCEAGWVSRHQLSTNDPNTYYRLSPDFAHLLASGPGAEREALVEKLRLGGAKPAARRSAEEAVAVRIGPRRTFALSPGLHSELAKGIVEKLGPLLLEAPQVVYLGDTADRQGFQDRRLLRRLNLPIDTQTRLPDVILFDGGGNRLLVVEAVVSSGPIDPHRLDQLRAFAAGPVALGVRLEYFSAFPSRPVLRRFVERIAWGTSVWIEDEPWNLIHFVRGG